RPRPRSELRVLRRPGRDGRRRRLVGRLGHHRRPRPGDALGSPHPPAHRLHPGRRVTSCRRGRRPGGGPMSRVLVTGGSGFLGSHVTRLLVEHPGIDTVVSGDLRDSTVPGVISERFDVTDATNLDSVLERHRIDTVVHLAAIVNPGRDVDLEYRVDVEGTSHVLDACVAAGVRRIIVSSSGAAYGYHPDNAEWIDEEDPVRGNDVFPYAKHKRLVEEMLAQARREHPQLEQVIFRIGTILGPTVRNQITALWDRRVLLRIAGSDSPFVFAWVDDVAGAMVRAVVDGPAGIYNVAGDGRL